MYERHNAMKNCLVVVFAAAVAACGLSLNAETWGWKPTSGSNWTEPKNWTNSVGQVGGADGKSYPNTGDTVYFGAYDNNNYAYAPNGSRYLYGLIIGPKANASISQGNYAFQAGGIGLQYLSASSQTGNWSGMYFNGNGIIPINIQNNVSFSMQMRMNATSGSNPIIVKQGLGLFNCFNEGGGSGAYTLPLVLIQQGTWNMANKGWAIANALIAFDGDDETQRLKFSYNAAWYNDLILNNSAIFETNGVANTTHGIVSDGDNQIAFTGTPKMNPMVFSGKFYTKAGLRWSPSSDAYTFVCSNAVSATTGRVKVQKGTVKLVTGASFTALSELSVSSGAVFEVEEGSGEGLNAETLTLGSSAARLNLATGVALTATSATMNGVAMAPGTYAAEAGDGVKKADWIVGAGTVTILTGPANADTWQGGAAGGTSALLADNWAGGSVDLESGEFLATFAAGGTAAALPAGTEAKFNGITFNNTTDGDAFAFTAGDGASAEIGSSSFVGISQKATTWTIGWPIVVNEAQDWQFGANDAVSIEGGISGTGNLSIESSSRVDLKAASSHSGTLDLKSGTVRVLADNALGAAARTVKFVANVVKLSFGGKITVDSPLTGSLAATSVTPNGFSIEEGADVTFNGKVTMPEDHRVTVGKDAVVTFKGGYSASNTGMNGRLLTFGSGTIVMTNGTFSLPFQIQGQSGNPVNFEFWSANNNINASRFYNWSSFYGRLTTKVENAFSLNKTWIQLRGGNAVWDLWGKNQSVALFHADSGCQVTSAEPALLTLTSQNYSEYNDNTNAGGTNRVDQATFTGLVSVKKSGPIPHTFGATSTSTGSVEVAGGDLLFNANGKWPNCMSVSATSTGRLVLRNSEAFNEKATLSVATTAQLQLDGCTNKFDRLYVDGHRKVGGTYGAVGSGAKHEVNWITGNGLLDVAEHGLILFLR